MGSIQPPRYLALQQPDSQVLFAEAAVAAEQQPLAAQHAASQLHSPLTAQVQSQDSQMQTVQPQLELFFSGAALYASTELPMAKGRVISANKNAKRDMTILHMDFKHKRRN